AMVVPSTAAAPTSSMPVATIKPAAATVVVEPPKMPSTASSMPVPLGAQSVIAAGNPGPGGVRYIPVPMVTIPDVRQAPVPPLMTAAQTYGTSATTPVAGAGTQMNAFTPAV